MSAPCGVLMSSKYFAAPSALLEGSSYIHFIGPILLTCRRGGTPASDLHYIPELPPLSTLPYLDLANSSDWSKSQNVVLF